MQRDGPAYQEYGYTGLFEQGLDKRSIHQVPTEQRDLRNSEKALGLFQTTYSIARTHFHQKLTQEHGIELGHSWVKQAIDGRPRHEDQCSRITSGTLMPICEYPDLDAEDVRQSLAYALANELHLSA